jgi:GPR endopeptidase
MEKDQVITDLALERMVKGEKLQNIDGTSVDTREEKFCKVTRIDILTDSAAQIVGKPCGRYITLEIQQEEELPCPSLVKTLAEELKYILNDTIPKSVLIAGLGNRHIPPDSLGSRTIDKVAVSRKVAGYAGIPAEVSVSAIAPGVLGITGIETVEILKGIVNMIHPELVIAIDSLCARDIHKIANTIQITDTGINPGSGLGNNRMGINQETLGCPVVAIGVPMVVYARTICHNAIELLIRRTSENTSDEVIDSVMNELTDGTINQLVVTPKDIDALTNDISHIIASAMNKVFATEAFLS